MSSIAIAGIQMHVSAEHDNLLAMRQQVDRTMWLFPWVQMVVFSELAPFGPALSHAITAGSDPELMFCEIAKKHRIWLIPGSHFELIGEQVFNTALVINPEGEIVCRYHKMFPFLPYEAGVTQGTGFCVFDVPDVGRFGLSICYDAWFPETTRTLVSMGAEVIIHPTLTGTLDRDVELCNARTTAALNQCYFFDVNGLGSGGNGRSIIVDPAGIPIFEAGQIEQCMPVELDLNRVRRARTRGINGLGQILKSFRDSQTHFSVYDRDNFDNSYLDSLGALEKPYNPRAYNPPLESDPENDL